MWGVGIGSDFQLSDLVAPRQKLGEILVKFRVFSLHTAFCNLDDIGIDNRQLPDKDLAAASIKSDEIALFYDLVSRLNCFLP